MAAKVLPLLALLLATWAAPTENDKRSPPAKRQGELFEVAEAGSFTNHITYNFDGTSMPEGLYVSNWLVPDPDAPFDHVFTPNNVVVGNGHVSLIVPGGQTTSPLSSAEFATTESNILYGSVRTVAIFGDAPGACNAAFFYKDDTQEADIEWLSDATSLSNPGDGTRPILYTNQDVNGVREDSTHDFKPGPSDLTTAEHEYRIDWVPGRTDYFVDGVLQTSFTTDVPTVPGSWLWNNWANGDPGWTGKPPVADNIYRISKIEMYYNVSSSA